MYSTDEKEEGAASLLWPTRRNLSFPCGEWVGGLVCLVIFGCCCLPSVYGSGPFLAASAASWTLFGREGDCYWFWLAT